MRPAAPPVPPEQSGLPEPSPQTRGLETSRLHSLHAMLLALVTVALVPVLGLSIWSHVTERGHEQRIAVERTAQAAGMIAEDLARETRNTRLFLELMAANPQVQTCNSRGRASDCAGVLASFAHLAPEYLNLHLVRPGGTILASARPVAPGASLQDDQAVMDALQGHIFSVGVGRGEGQETAVTYAAPVRNAQGGTVLVLAAQMALTQASKTILNAGLPQGTTVVLAGAGGRLLFRFPDVPDLAAVSLPEEHARLIREKVAEASGWTTGLDGVERYYVMRRLEICNGEVCYVRVGIPKSAVYAESSAKFVRHLSGLLIITVLVLLLTRMWGGYYILRPVGRLMAAVRALGAGDFGARTGLGRKDPGGAGELGELASTFDVMAEGMERHQAEQEAARKALHESEERLRAVFNASADGLLLLVPDGRVLSMNESAARRRNETPVALEGKNILDLIPEYVRNGRRVRYEEVVRTGAPMRFEEEREGRTYAIRLYPIYGDDGTVCQIASFSRDITERKLSERALEAAKEAAEAASQAKDDFMTNMSHELRTPLNGLAGMLKLLAQGGLSPDQAEYLAYAQQTTRQLTDLINDVLDYAALGSGQMALEHKLFRLSEVLAPLEAELRPVAEGKGLALVIQAQPGVLSQPLLGDPLRLGQALRHLLENALKFTHQGGVTLVAAIVSRDEGNCTLRLQLADTGIGIDPEQLKRVYKPFVQVEAPLTKRYSGTGLGLTIVRELVVKMGGRVEAESQTGKGSTFTLCLSFQTPSPRTAPEGGAGLSA